MKKKKKKTDQKHFYLILLENFLLFYDENGKRVRYCLLVILNENVWF